MKDELKYILGVDPGNQGALALYEPESKRIELFDMPTRAAGRGKYARDVDGYQLGVLIDSLKIKIACAWVEQVSSRPRQGGMFAFGTSYGRVLGVLEANLIPIRLVPASKWKPALGLRGAEKSMSIALAATMFPSIADQLLRKKDDGRAEALLISYYGSKSAQLTSAT